jgi:hypothetical protein
MPSTKQKYEPSTKQKYEPSTKQKYEPSTKPKYESMFCNNTMTFQDCELAILRHAVDESEMSKGKKLANSEAITEMINIVEGFLVRKKCLCYGGTAINNILPKYAQFYNREVEVPDYDFFTPNAIDDAKELADLFFEAGYTDVEAKSGMHQGTYKVFVNFIPMADITFLEPQLFDALSRDAISVAGIKYTPPNFLRMSMYLELSRPAGDVSRWEKVLKRLNLLNTYYPMKLDYKCSEIEFQRRMAEHADESVAIYELVRDTLIEMGVVFFGGYAFSLYARYMPKMGQKLTKRIPDFDVLSEDIHKTVMILEERLQGAGYKKIKQIYHPPLGETVPEHIEIRYGNEIIAFLYTPVACHNYNTIHIGRQEINVATIDTIMSFYLAFIYAGAGYYQVERIMCMAKFLFEVEEKNRLSQRGLLRRFSMKCVGDQETPESIRATKAAKFAELKDKKGTQEYEEWFMKYTPGNKGVAKNRGLLSVVESAKQENQIRKSEKKSGVKNVKTRRQRGEKSMEISSKSKRVFPWLFV